MDRETLERRMADALASRRRYEVAVDEANAKSQPALWQQAMIEAMNYATVVEGILAGLCFGITGLRDANELRSSSRPARLTHDAGDTRPDH
jgi:hypothetical protein